MEVSPENNHNKLDIVLSKWQKGVDLLSELFKVPAALIMRYDKEQMEVLISSNSANNSYKIGEKEKWHGLYCETVITTQQKLLIPNALNDKKWNQNPDIKLGMISYLGFPVNYSDNKPFGTICILDNKENPFSELHEKFLLHYKEIIEQDLLLVESFSTASKLKFDDFNSLLKQRLLNQESNNTYRRLFESSNAAILVISADFLFIDCNAMAQKMFGRPKNEIVGKSPEDSTLSPKYQSNGESTSELGRRYFASAMEGNDQRFEWTHLKKDGTKFEVEVSLFGFMASNKKNFFAMWRDLSEVKKKEKELIESEERFRNIFTQSSDGVLIIQMGSGFIDCNQSAIKLLGYDDKAELLGVTPWQISPEYQPDGTKSVAKAKAYMQSCIDTGKEQFEWVHLKKDGTPIWFEIMLTHISFQNHDLIHCAWRDITDKRKYLEELEEHRNHLENKVHERTKELEVALYNLKAAQSQLIQSEKMASLGVLTSGVAHEINNPLNYILGSYSGLKLLLDKNCNENEQLEKLLNSLKIGIERVSGIVKGLNQFSRTRRIVNETCDIHSIIDNCLLMLNNQFEDRINITKNFAATNSACIGNTGQLHQVFINIMTNAIQSIEHEGEISITTEIIHNFITIKISDTGCGIKKEDLSKILDPFFTTKEPGKGAGLGLSIAYTIITENKGKIEFDSKLNNGTTVKILLPVNKHCK